MEEIMPKIANALQPVIRQIDDLKALRKTGSAGFAPFERGSQHARALRQKASARRKAWVVRASLA
jgi:hypothetical protein